MKVKVTEEVLRSDGYNLVDGDTLTVPDEVGTKWCGLGWAEDVDGNIETGERVPGVVRIAPDKGVVAAGEGG